MTKNELLIAADLLEKASEEFSNHGCNDYQLPMTQENIDMLNKFEQLNVGEGNEPDNVYKYDSTKKVIYTMDFVLMNGIRKLLLQVA